MNFTNLYNIKIPGYFCIELFSGKWARLKTKYVLLILYLIEPNITTNDGCSRTKYMNVCRCNWRELWKRYMFVIPRAGKRIACFFSLVVPLSDCQVSLYVLSLREVPPHQ